MKTCPKQATALLLAPLAYLGTLPGVWTRRGEAPPLASTDLDRRRPVWRVLSELYLDTWLDDDDHERIASVLVESRYSTAQLEEILYCELHPVLRGNLRSLAGEWAAFDPQWLEDQVLRRGPRRSRWAIVPGKWMVQSGWAILEAKLQKVER